MPHVSGHYRNGRWVRPHYRRSTPRSVQGTGQVRVKAHRRADGTLVRSHYRTVEPPAPGSSSSGSSWVDEIGAALAGLVLLILVLAVISQV